MSEQIITITPTSAETAKRYGVRLETVKPRILRVVGPDGLAEIRCGVGDGQLRLFAGGHCYGVFSEGYIFEEAFDLESGRWPEAPHAAGLERWSAKA